MAMQRKLTRFIVAALGIATLSASAQEQWTSPEAPAMYNNIVPLEKRWSDDEWQKECEEYRTTLEAALFSARNALNNSKTNSTDGYRQANRVLVAAMRSLADDTDFAERWFQPVARRLGRLALDLDQALARNMPEEPALYEAQRYNILEALATFTFKQIEVFDSTVFSEFASRDAFDIRRVERGYLGFVSELVQKMILRESMLSFPDRNGQLRKVVQGSYSTFYTVVSIVTSFAYRELSNNLYGHANACAIRDLRSANGYASQWIRNTNSGVDQHQLGMFHATLEVIERIKGFTTTPECQFYRTNGWVYPAGFVSPSSHGRLPAKGERK